MILELLENKNARERADIKSKEIMKLGDLGKYKEKELEIEVQGITKIANGIEIFARAWRDGEQLGFGKDGTVDLERFLIYNPPILVDDPAGTIVRKTINEEGDIRIRTLREDPLEAIRLSLAHTIGLVGKESANITPGKVGRTTSTFYPDPDPETTSVDGATNRFFGVGSGEAWATLIAGAGNLSDDTATTTSPMAIRSDDASPKFRLLARAIWLFDTSAIPDADTIDSATFSLYGIAKQDNLSITPNINVYSSAPASNTAIVNADFTTLGSTAFSTAITYAGWNTAAYNDFALNASGLAAISKTGVSKFGTRNVNYDVDAVAPTWSSNVRSDMECDCAETAGTANDPKLVVVHTTPSAATYRGFFAFA